MLNFLQEQTALWRECKSSLLERAFVRAYDVPGTVLSSFWILTNLIQYHNLLMYNFILQVKNLRCNGVSYLPKVVQLIVAELGLEPRPSGFRAHILSPVLCCHSLGAGAL